MAKKGSLFLLIKSMSKSEKRYFKLTSSHGNNQNYLKLFDAIDAQNEFDEAAIKQKFKKETFIKQLHVTKNYLTKLIMRSLRNFHSQVSASAEIHDLLREVELLFRRELFDQCHYTIEKALGMAEQYECFPGLIELLGWKRKLLLARAPSGMRNDVVNETIKLEQDVLKKADHINRYWYLTINMFDLINSNAPRFVEEYEMEPLVSNPLVKDASKADSLQAKVLYNHVMFAYSVVTGKGADEGIRYVDNLIAELEARPDRIKDDPSAYITALHNKIGTKIFDKKLDAVKPLLDKVRNIPEAYGIKDKTMVTIKAHLKTYNVELELYRDMHNYEAGAALEDTVMEYLNKHEGIVPFEYYLLLHYQFAYIMFMKGDLDKALFHANQIITRNFENIREDLQSYTRFLSLMIHFELGNIMIIKYAVDSTRRFLKKKRKLEPFEKTLLQFFSKISVVPKADYPELFESLKQLLFKGMDDESVANVIDYLDFYSWIEDKLAKA